MRSARVQRRNARDRGTHCRQLNASSTRAANATRNQATVAGSTSPNNDLARIDPMFWDRPARTKTASGENAADRCAPSAACAATSVKEVRIGAADLLPQRAEAEPTGE